jgi:hypothetical protein
MGLRREADAADVPGAVEVPRFASAEGLDGAQPAFVSLEDGADA